MKQPTTQTAISERLISLAIEAAQNLDEMIALDEEFKIAARKGWCCGVGPNDGYGEKCRVLQETYPCAWCDGAMLPLWAKRVKQNAKRNSNRRELIHLGRKLKAAQ